MNRLVLVGLAVMFAVVIAVLPEACSPGQTETAVADVPIPCACECRCVPVGPDPPIEPPIDPEPPPSTQPTAYIQWTCHPTKPTCQDRFDWSSSLDNAYTQWRGHVDLEYLRVHGQAYLEGGDRELVPLTVNELGLVIRQMEDVDARGNRVIHRIETLRHRDFDPKPLGEWHRSQVRKDVARLMRDELKGETTKYNAIAEEFPPVSGCDAIACKVKKMNEIG